MLQFEESFLTFFCHIVDSGPLNRYCDRSCRQIWATTPTIL